MRILHLINHCHRGNGNVHAAIDLACAQVQAGHEVLFGSGGGFLEATLQASGVRTIALPHSLRHPGLAGRRLASACADIVAARPDIVHAHMMSGAAVGFTAARIIGCPLVTTVHNSFNWHSRLMAIGDMVVAVSHAEKATLVRRGFNKRRLAVIWNGPLGSPRYGPVPPPASREDVIVSVCGLHPRKGVKDILHAFGEIAPRFPSWRLRFVGEGPDMASLTAAAAAMGLAHRVEFLGLMVDPTSVLQTSEVFVLGSIAEPFGLAAVEARAAGCAIVATRVGGLPEILANGEAGLLVDPASPAQIAGALSALIADLNLRRGFQDRAKQNLDAFKSDRLVRDYDRVYSRLLRDRRRLRRQPDHRTEDRVDAQR